MGSRSVKSSTASSTPCSYHIRQRVPKYVNVFMTNIAKPQWIGKLRRGEILLISMPRLVMHWILSPPDSYLKALPRTAIIYGDRAFKEVIKLKQSFKDGALIQQDVFLRSTNTRDLHTQRTGQVTMLREDRSLWATQRGLGGNLPYWRLDLGLSAFRTVGK